MMMCNWESIIKPEGTKKKDEIIIEKKKTGSIPGETI